MKYSVMQGTDLELSHICLGAAGFGDKLDERQSFELLDAYVRQGGNFIDTANVYCKWVPGRGNCSEQVLGKWLRARGAHKDVIIATKGGHYNFGSDVVKMRVNEKEIRIDLEESMKTLGLEVIDFYWLHRDDESKPIEEIVDILELLKKEGKIRYYGFSNYRTERAAQARKYLLSKGLFGPYAISNQWSMASVNSGKNINSDPTLVLFSPEEFQWHKETGVAAVPFSSTALGFFEKLKAAGIRVQDGVLTSLGDIEKIPPKIRAAYWNDDNLKKFEKLMQLQQEKGHSLQALSLAWLIHQPFQVFPVASARNLEQLAGIMAAGDM